MYQDSEVAMIFNIEFLKGFIFVAGVYPAVTLSRSSAINDLCEFPGLMH